MSPRFAMFYPDGSPMLDDGEDVEVTFRVPRVWLDAPKDGLQIVVEHLPDGKMRLFQQYDRYFTLPGGQPKGADSTDPLLRSLGILKHGLWLPDDEYDQVRERVRLYRRAHELHQKG